MRLILLAFFLVICGCATTKPIEANKLSQIKNVGAISLLGNTLNIVQIGPTIFNNAVKFEIVKDWNIDGFVIDQIKYQLSTNSSLTYKPIKHDVNEFTDVYKSHNNILYADYDIDYIKDRLISIRDSFGIDTLILLTSARRDVTGHGIFTQGYATLNWSFLGIEVTSLFVIGATITVIDLKELVILSESPITNYFGLKSGFCKENITDYSQKELMMLKKYILNSIEFGIPRSLENIGLIKIPDNYQEEENDANQVQQQ